MKITVDRTIDSEGNLVFTISVKEPHKVPFTELENNMMTALETCKKHVDSVQEDNKVKNDILSSIHDAKEKTFSRILQSLRFAITNELRPKFQPICQEIYNWIYDNQEGPTKMWMQEVDPQRTKYYFDNDKTVESDIIMDEENDF